MKARVASDTDARRRSAALLIVVSLLPVAAAERDIERRPGAQVRGGKRIWRLASLNALGALAYFRWGRRAA